MRHALPGLRASIDEARRGVAFEGESTLPLERIVDHQLSWAQWFADSSTPGVLRARWFERRHMLHHTRRWNRDHSSELQSAWLNGAGMLVWESVFGSWVGWSARDRSMLRAMVAVQRRYAGLLTNGAWTPLAARSLDGPWPSIVGSRFSAAGATLWTLVNRTPIDVAGARIDLGALPAGTRVFDLIAGHELERAGDVRPGIRGRGVGALLALEEGVDDDDLDGFLAARRLAAPTADASFPARVPVRVVHGDVVAELPQGMGPVDPGPLTARFRRRETGTYAEAPYVEEWKPLPPRLHDEIQVERPAPPARFAVEIHEVTNAQFAVFLGETRYRPPCSHRFLAHWVDGAPRVGDLDRAVTFVDVDDARAYARWRGARLPSEDEWQLAGEAGLLERSDPAVWNLTESEHRDGRVRFLILKGGSAYHAAGSDWYFDGGIQGPDFSAKLVLPGAGLARSSQIGFRCAVTLA
jgi:sulfatase-modifying factor enzyme 1